MLAGSRRGVNEEHSSYRVQGLDEGHAEVGTAGLGAPVARTDHHCRLSDLLDNNGRSSNKKEGSAWFLQSLTGKCNNLTLILIFKLYIFLHKLDTFLGDYNLY